MAGNGSNFEIVFPGLTGGGYQITSPANKCYNCVAWAAGDSSNWWWPSDNFEDEYWPASVAREWTISAFQHAFATLGYAVCSTPDHDPGFEKIAIYCDQSGRPLHVARQLPSGRWTSKLGRREDIDHDLDGLAGELYGFPSDFMRRPIAIGSTHQKPG